MTGTVPRPDLSARTAVSKSALTGFDACQHAAWFDLHARRPLIPHERITFGSAVDRAVEKAVEYIRMGAEPDMGVCAEAAAEVIARDGVAVDLDAVATAVIRFAADVAPRHDLSHARLQAHVSGFLPDFGDVDGHPDVWLPGAIWDVKTGKRPKGDEPTVELGFYALLAAEVEGEPVERVGYWTWVRTARPYWQEVSFAVTPELLRWTVERTAAYVRARRADEVLNRGAERPVNWSFPGGPRYGCGSCQYADVCDISEVRRDGAPEEATDDAA